MVRCRFTRFFVFILAALLFTGPLYSSDTFTAEVTDISDRRYEPAVIELIDSAAESIVISMYGISLGTDTRNPVTLLLDDLLEARGRGVEVTIVYNTLFRDTPIGETSFETSEVFRALADAGCALHAMPQTRRLHDKLIIVDKRYVVEGSTNWSIAALRDNYESATLIDSPDLARVKLARIDRILMSLLADYGKERPPSASYLGDLPQSLSIPGNLLTVKSYFPAMVSASDERSMDLYLLLLGYSQKIGEGEFFISLEDMALSLGMPDSWDDTTLRRQVIRVLEKLETGYGLITARFFHGKDARVILTPLSGDAFRVASGPIILDDISMRHRFLLLIQAFLRTEGEELDSVSQRALAERFGVSLSTITSAFKDLRRHVKMKE